MRVAYQYALITTKQRGSVKALLTRKLGMTTIISDNGTASAVTLLSADPIVVTQVKSTDVDGYNALQVGVGEDKKPSKSHAGHVKASGSVPKVLKEFRVDELGELKVGDKITAENFELGDSVHVTAISKGKGWAGTIKRHNFHRGRKTHGGQSYRRPGSIGSMYPQRIFPGKKMAGKMGYEQVTVKNLKIALIDNELSVIGVFGAVPGPKKGLVVLKGAK